MFIAITFNASAGNENFSKGPVFKDFGENVMVANSLANPQQQQFKVLFDISKVNDKAGVNGHFNTVARFINMHVRAGVPLKNIEVAMVVHGKAGFDLLKNDAYQARFKKDNASAELVSLLLDAKVKIFICGQSARYLNIANPDLISKVEMSLSAMTANALLQQQGYSLNPF